MAPKKAEFTKDIEIRLIYEVQQHPILWDTTSEQYRRTDLKPRVWEEIAAKLGESFTGDSVKLRFKNMKETFTKNLLKVRASQRSGAGTNDIYKPVWYLYIYLTFLEKACPQASSTDNLSENSQEEASLSPHVVPTVASTSMSHISGTAINQDFSYCAALDACLDPVTKEWRKITQEVPEECIEIQNSHEIDDPRNIDGTIELGDSPMDIATAQRLASVPTLLTKTKQSGSPSQDEFFKKRGSGKKGGALIEKAVSAIEKLASEPMPVLSTKETPSDTFCNMLNTRLSAMSDEDRKRCENAILTILLDF